MNAIVMSVIDKNIKDYIFIKDSRLCFNAWYCIYIIYMTDINEEFNIPI